MNAEFNQQTIFVGTALAIKSRLFATNTRIEFFNREKKLLISLYYHDATRFMKRTGIFIL